MIHQGTTEGDGMDIPLCMPWAAYMHDLQMTENQDAVTCPRCRELLHMLLE